ncbi:hypothetical protein [Solemya velesiana gill symbiont]|uniref:hypothetical protein n=1 Tax=Solemya velesiana gill symbiont TaxID=1918948 RepID=UPI0012902173|nr:hypothetical protein [Solemya velesiana gill symbiont]
MESNKRSESAGIKNRICPVLFMVHVEPNDRKVSYQAPRWSGYEILHEYLFKMRPLLESATRRPVRFSWMFRLDPQIELVYGRADWVVHQYRSLLEEADSAGDELGIHVHSWRPYRHLWKKKWLAEFSDKNWVSHCVDMAHQAFVDSYGKQPKSFSFGEHYMSDAVLMQLESLGYRCDISMHPGLEAAQSHVHHDKSKGWLPYYRATPRYPFKPSKKNFCYPLDGDERNIWEMPVSVGIAKDALGQL